MAKPSIFISYDYDNDSHYKRLLMAWDSNDLFDFSFYDESVDVSVNSTQATVIKRVISGRIANSDLLLVIVGSHTHESDWVDWEIRKALELDKPIVAVKINAQNTSPSALLGVGVSWAKSFTFDSIVSALSGI